MSDDLLDNIFEDIENSYEPHHLLLDLLNSRIENVAFQVISNNETRHITGDPTEIEEEIRFSLQNEVNETKSTVQIENTDGSLISGIPLKRLNAVLIYKPEHSITTPELKQSVDASINICVELFHSRNLLKEEQELIEVQKVQLSRRLNVLEIKNQEILEENNHNYQIIRKQQDDYAQKLQSEIEAQTAELKKVNDQLKEISRLQKKTLEVAATAIITVDTNQTIINVNDEFCLITSYKKNEIVGKHYDVLVTDKDGNLSDEPEEDIEKPVYKTQCTLFTKEGKKLTVIKNADNLYDKSKKLTGRIESFVDVTDLIEARENAEAASIAKSEFLANMSHEIRTPINGIIGMSEIIMETTLDDEQVELVNTINSESGALLGIINDILDFSKIEAGMLELETIPFNLRSVIEELANGISIQAEQKGLQIYSYIPADNSVFMLGDPGRLRQILMNLAGNALKFTHTGEIAISAKKIEDLDDKIKIYFQVKDTGIGIPKNKQASIFDSFTQADGSTTRNYGGTGLGTTISKQLTEIMGGEIGIYSEEGVGSTFWFTAIFQKTTGEDKTTLQIDVNDIPDSEIPKDLQILLYDPSETGRHITSQYIFYLGSSCIETDDTKTIIPIMKEAHKTNNSIDVVILNFIENSPKIIDLIKDIKTIEELSMVPVILQRPTGTSSFHQKSYNEWVTGFLTRPVKFNSLKKTLRNAVGKTYTKELFYPREIEPGSDDDKIKLLLAEDYATNQMVVLSFLKSDDFEIDVVENGKLAVEAFEKKQYDVIIMDMQMPVMDGYEATRTIRKIEAGKEISTDHGKRMTPIIAMTANAMEGDKRKCFFAGTNDFIAKPLKRVSFLEIIHKWAPKIPSTQMNPSPGKTDELKTNVNEKTSQEATKQTKESVLLVEDNKSNQKVALRHIQNAGFNVELAENGEEAVSAYKKNHYDLILMDVQMPIMDGYEATKIIRSLELEMNTGSPDNPSRVPIIAATANAMQGDKDKCINAGMDDYISKPLKKKDLISKIEKWVIPKHSHPEENEAPQHDTPMDYNQALLEFENDDELLKEILISFTKNLKKQFPIISQALSDGNAEAIRMESHAIKGGAANLTANALSDVAFELEKIGKSGNLEKGTELLTKLENEFNRFEDYIKTI